MILTLALLALARVPPSVEIAAWSVARGVSVDLALAVHAQESGSVPEGGCNGHDVSSTRTRVPVAQRGATADPGAGLLSVAGLIQVVDTGFVPGGGCDAQLVDGSGFGGCVCGVCALGMLSGQRQGTQGLVRSQGRYGSLATNRGMEAHPIRVRNARRNPPGHVGSQALPVLELHLTRDTVISRTGDAGRMQVNVSAYARLRGIPRAEAKRDLLNRHVNILVGVSILAGCVGRFGDQAAACYNGGPSGRKREAAQRYQRAIDWRMRRAAARRW